MASPTLMRTGVFARASSLSVKALRLYHETGLLVPSVVDPETGYRAYSPAQLIDATIIRLLRGVGVSLPDIRAVLDARDLGVVRKVLTEQAAELQAGLDAVARVIDDLGLEDDDDLAVTIRHESSCTVLAVDGRPVLADLEGFVIRSASLLTEAASTTGAVVDGCVGASFPVPVEDERQDVTTFLPIASPVLVPSEVGDRGVRVDVLPECDVAVVEHVGSSSGLDACYRRLGAWVAFHAVPNSHPVRERYLTAGDPFDDRSVTELQWPVDQAAHR